MKTAKEKVISLINFNVDMHLKELEHPDISEPSKVKARSSIFILKRLQTKIEELKDVNSLDIIDKACHEANEPGIPIHHNDRFLNWSYYCASKLIEEHLGLALTTWQVSLPIDKFSLDCQKRILFDFIEELPKIDRSLEHGNNQT